LNPIEPRGVGRRAAIRKHQRCAGAGQPQRTGLSGFRSGPKNQKALKTVSQCPQAALSPLMYFGRIVFYDLPMSPHKHAMDEK
jgi:hypothetical protein